MENITRFAIKNTRFTILLLGVICLYGVFVFMTMPRQEDPEITIRNAQVMAYYPGMSPTLMENLIAKPIEKMVKQIPEVEEIKTTVKNGFVIIEPKIYDRYFNMDPIWQDLRNKMEDIKPELPQGTQGPYVNDDFGRVAAITIALHGRGFNMSEFRDVARDLQDKLGVIPSLSKVELYGVQKEFIYLSFNASQLAYYGISTSELLNSLQQQNIVLPGGSMKMNGERISIEVSGRFHGTEDIMNVQIRVPHTDKMVYLQDIAQVSRQYEDPVNQPAFYNNQPAVVLSLSMVSRYNIEHFGKEVKSKLTEIKKSLPLGMYLDFATYQPELVKQSVSSATSNLYQTVLVVLFVVIFFLGLRTGLIVGATVPFTILLSIIAMNYFAIDLQRMSIAAIIIALGLLVDNGIVIAEDIQSRMEQGEAKYDAVLSATKTLGFPLLTSSITTMLAFMPLVMANDATSEFLMSLSLVIVITLSASWFLAMYATPTLCFWFLEEKSKQESSLFLQKSYFYYDLFLKNILARPARFLLFMLLLLLLSLAMLKLVTKQMMPYSDRNQFLVYIDLPAASDVSETQKAVRMLAAWLADKNINPEVTNNIAYVGFGGPRFFLSLSPPDPGQNVAFMVVNVQHLKDVRTLVNRLNQFAANELPNADVRAKPMWLGAQEIGLVEYRLSGPDVKILYKLAYQMESKLKSIPGSYGVINDWQNPVLRIQVNVDQTRARRAGVSSEVIAQVLNAYFDGYEMSDYREGDKVIPIVLRGEESRNNLANLRSVTFMSENQVPIPLLQVADLKSSIVPGRMMRFQQERTIKVSAKNTFLQASQVHEQLLPFLNVFKLPEGYHLEVGGEIEGSEKANQALFANLPFALICIAALLVLQFNSLRRPLIILCTIPLIVIGASVGLLTMRAMLSFTAVLGLYSLAGIIINNGIVLIERIDQVRAEGYELKEAIVNACVARFRPIIMTTLTTTLGLIPLALFGGELWYPMAVVIIFGLLVGSVLTLGVVPVLYFLFFGQRTNIKILNNQ